MGDKLNLEVLSNYVLHNMFHRSANAFLLFIDEDVGHFEELELVVDYQDSDCKRYCTDDFVAATRLKLADSAIEHGCLYVTNLYYCQYSKRNKELIITGTGLKKRI